MDSKDLLTLIGISASIILGLFNLYILIKNRRNVVREHLYKEQMAFFIKLNKEFTDICLLYDRLQLNVPDKLDMTEEVLQLLDKKSTYIYSLINQYDLIIPNEILSSAYQLINKIDILTSTLLTVDEVHIKSEYDEFYKIYFKFLEELRELLGVDRLSSENLKLFKK